MTATAIMSDCCCAGGEVYIAFPCWENRTVVFEINTTTPFTRTFIANGASANSNNPPAGTLARLVLIGAGGAGNGLDAGGGGAYVETQVALASTTMTFRTGHGGAVTNVGATVFGGGAQGASNTRYGGGASAFALNASSNFIAAGGGAAASANYTEQTSQTSRGGDGGIGSSLRPSTDVSTAGGSTTTAGGSGGVTGGGAGVLGTLPAAGAGGAGVATSSGQGGGGGGGGGRASGGGGGNQTQKGITRGGAGTGGSSLNGNPSLSHSGKNGYAQASPFTNLTTTRGIGDGGLAAGGAGRAALAWRACSSCPCPEMPTGIPPALHVCITQAQFNAMKAAAGADPCANASPPSPYIGFTYQGWPFYISANPTPIASRPCDRLAASSDIGGAKWVRSSNYCCQLWRLPRWTGTSPLCTPDCAGQQGCPDFIYLCDEYRRTLGLPPCPDALGGNQCYFVQYNGCDYKFTGDQVDGDCLTPAPSPLNVGTGYEIGDCTTGKVGNTWTVGPNVFTGGFQCGSSYSLKWDATGYQWCDSLVTACRIDVGSWGWQFKMDCLVVGTGEDSCYSGLPPCACGAPWDSNTCSVAGVNRPARKREALCNTTADPNVCSDACSCPGWLGTAQSTWLNGTPDGSELPYVPALTITRNCPHPTSTTWLSVDEAQGSVTIDGCTFVGNGTAADFAQRINEVLGDRLTAVGSQAYWIGPRWRGSLPYPQDYECNGGWMGGTAASNGDRCQVVSNTSTVGVIACQYLSVWFLRADVSVSALTVFSQQLGACTCSGSPACTAAATYESVYQVERPDQPILFPSFGPMTLAAGFPAFMTCCQPDPYAWTPPSSLVIT